MSLAQSFSFADYGGYRPGLAGITAGGTTQGDATPLLRQVNRIDLVLPNGGVILPKVQSSNCTEIIVLNRGQNDARCYPPFNGRLENQAVNAPWLLERGTSAGLLSWDSVMNPGLIWSIMWLTSLSLLQRQDQYAQDLAPAGPNENGDIWWDSQTAETFIWYDDGDTAQWVSFSKTTAALTAMAKEQVAMRDRIARLERALLERS